MKNTRKIIGVARNQRNFHSSPKASENNASAYVESQYEAWKADPSQVHESWDNFFKNANHSTSSDVSAEIQAQKTIVEVQNMLTAYRRFGHFHAKIDPLEIPRKQREELKLSRFHFSESDLGNKIRLGFLARPEEKFDDEYTLGDFIKNLEASYCSSIGVEFMHIQDVDQCNWIRTHVEKGIFTAAVDDNNVFVPPDNEKIKILDELIKATLFEEFLQSKFNEKRFGCDGAESVIAGINQLVDTSADFGIEDIVIGMAHRGRINVLTNVMGKPFQNIFREFLHGTLAQDNASGDVKYHLGVSCNRQTTNGKKIHLSLVANPSHLEAVNPVVEGKVKAKQQALHKDDQSKALSLLIHGDGSFAGQGIVAETITMSGLPKYSTGGTIHVIINNQVSFTTNPVDARPDDYCTGVAIPTGQPIFHVNGDDPEAVNWAFKLAVEWRQRFQKDVVIDVNCYRRFGHNESDQPYFTQPVMYQKIAKMPKTIELYSQKLIGAGIMTQAEFDLRRNKFLQVLEAEYAEARKTTSFDSTGKGSFYQDLGQWQGFYKDSQSLKSVRYSTIAPEVFDSVGKALTTLPENFTVHPTIGKMLQAKQQMIQLGKGIDWATAEALAFGSLLSEGIPVRLSGQDVERGTFSHRHAVLHDQSQVKREYIPLDHVQIPGKTTPNARLSITNSFLSEYAALGYEYGYALETPQALVIWEAQFGDFANGGQIIIDQFLSGCEQKWQRQNGLVMLLPHGMEGQGPEHSSARLERFLQLCDQNTDEFSPLTVKQVKDTNMQVLNLTMPANYFHALRRQVLREFRKPLIIMSPKSLLRHPGARSDRAAFDSPQLKFIRVYGEADKTIVPAQVTRLIFCSGKVYFDLLENRKDRKDIAIVRIEQLAPFPFDDVESEVLRYPNADIVWCQEEHKNHGAWHFIYFNFKTVFKHAKDSRKLKYVGRPTAASPATGAQRQHKKELAAFMSEAMAEAKVNPLTE